MILHSSGSAAVMAPFVSLKVLAAVVVAAILLASSIANGDDERDDNNNATTAITTVSNSSSGQQGHELCPCLSPEELGETVVLRNLTDILGDGIVDFAEYGTTCAPHDVGTPQCSDSTDCAELIPLPLDCEKSWCSRSFCYVNPDNCELVNDASALFQGRYFSYATCGKMDSFTFTERLKSLEGQTLRVGFASNTGGWRGAYNPNGSYAVNELWTGPMYDFAKAAAQEGGFTIKNTKPPDFLRKEAMEVFGHDSDFDFCVYATSLGYLDFCVAGFKILDRRSTVATMYEVTNDPLNLVIFADEPTKKRTWEDFKTAAKTIFQPFTGGAWLMIWLFALPVLGLLMLFHEYGMPGSAYGTEEPVLVTDKSTGVREVKTRRIPIVKHCTSALYRSALAFFQGSYDLSVMTVGGKINLLAFAAFIMLILSIYTANLAAILTQDLHKPSVDSIEAALRAGYNFCAERQVALVAIDLFDVPREAFVPDPEDGLPGFLCCSPRERVFDFMKSGHDNDKSLYCNAGIAVTEDLQALQQFQQHCNKTRVGAPLKQQAYGFPISPRWSSSLVSLFHQIKIDGTAEKLLQASEPNDRCERTQEGEEGSALSIDQLTGVWVITFSLALVSLVTKLANPAFWNGNKNKSGVRQLQYVNQWGEPADMDEPEVEEENEPLDPSWNEKKLDSKTTDSITVKQTFNESDTAGDVGAEGQAKSQGFDQSVDTTARVGDEVPEGAIGEGLP